MATRPHMHAKNSSGNSISLLNDDGATLSKSYPPPTMDSHHNYAVTRPSQLTFHPASKMLRTDSTGSSQSYQSNPRTPGLERSHSTDTIYTGNPSSPITPVTDLGRPSLYTGYGKEPIYEEHGYGHYSPRPKLCQMASAFSPYDAREASYPNMYPSRSDDMTISTPKKYPCRLREAYNCDMRFTTSGHASRHAKIHTSEKSVHCTWPSCPKKFTRADNMKQHLETHKKNKDRSKAQTLTGKTALTRQSGILKNGQPSRPSSSSSISSGISSRPELRSQSPFGTPNMSSPLTRQERNQSPEYVSQRQHAYSLLFTPRPSVNRTGSSSQGLDTLAAVAETMQTED